MRTVIMLTLMILACGNAIAKDWYVVLNETHKCAKESVGPGDFIELLQADKIPYKVEETKESGKLAKVKVIDLSDHTQVVYYTSKSVCQKALDRQKLEANKYR